MTTLKHGTVQADCIAIQYKYPFSEISQHIQSIRALFSRSSSWSR